MRCETAIPTDAPKPAKMCVRTSVERWLTSLMRARAVHPLLLEPAYWRDRLRCLEGGPVGVVWTPRHDLSGRGVEAMEFRIVAHDGERLWGLFAWPAWQNEPWKAIVRSVGPAERPEIDARRVREGVAEFIFQEPAGRRLSDRVVDVLHVVKLAFQTRGIGDVEVETEPGHGAGPSGASSSAVRADAADDCLIAEQILLHRMGGREADSDF